MAICKAEEWHRDGRGLWAMRSCISHDGHKSSHTFEPWRYNVVLPAMQGGIVTPDNPEIIQRLTAIRRALTHPQFYDGDIGADIRWLLQGYELLRQHAKSHQRDYASLAKKLDIADRQIVALLDFVRELSEWSVFAHDDQDVGVAIHRARQLVATASLGR